MIHLPPATAGSSLRERLIEDMTVRGFTGKTRKDYIRTVAGFAAFLELSPSTATAEHIRRFQIHQSERGMNAPAMNSTVAVLHTWGSALTDHPHIHMIVPGGGIALNGERWISSRPAFLLPVRVLGKLFRRLFLTRLLELHQAGQLPFYGAQTGLRDRTAFQRHLAPVRKKPWVVYAKPPFAGPAAVLAYLSRDTHRVAISNRSRRPIPGRPA